MGHFQNLTDETAIAAVTWRVQRDAQAAVGGPNADAAAQLLKSGEWQDHFASPEILPSVIAQYRKHLDEKLNLGSGSGGPEIG
jgi:hypothetical protein